MRLTTLASERRGDVPVVALRVAQPVLTLAVVLVRWLPEDRGSGSLGPLVVRVHVPHVKHDSAGSGVGSRRGGEATRRRVQPEAAVAGSNLTVDDGALVFDQPA